MLMVNHICAIGDTLVYSCKYVQHIVYDNPKLKYECDICVVCKLWLFDTQTCSCTHIDNRWSSIHILYIYLSIGCIAFPNRRRVCTSRSTTVCSWLLSVQSAATPNVCLTLTQNFWCWWTPRSPKTEYGNTTHMVWYFYVMAVKPDRYGLEHCIKDT